jgi:hypothetical protein
MKKTLLEFTVCLTKKINKKEPILNNHQKVHPVIWTRHFVHIQHDQDGLFY